MVSEAIDAIRQAEDEAENLVREGRARAKKVMADAHESAERLLEETRQVGRDEEKALVETARAQAEAEAERIAGESEKVVEAAGRDGAARVGSAVKRVLEAITAAG